MAATTEFLSLVRRELRAIAAHLLRSERPNHTLQPTALVHEAWLKLFADGGPAAEDRRHFLALAGRVMRQHLIDHARARARDKRGGRWQRVTLDETRLGLAQGGVDVLDLHAALEELARLDERQARVVELRYFAGLTIEETALSLGVGQTTVRTDWRMARAWLRRRISGS